MKIFEKKVKENRLNKYYLFGIKVYSCKIHHKQNTSLLFEEMEKDIIAHSRWWDAAWYVKTYNHNFNRYEALDYWYKTGWKQGENPSQYINVAHYTYDINPIIAYLSKGIKRVFFLITKIILNQKMMIRK